MNKEAKTNLILSLLLVASSIFSFVRGKTILGVSGAALAVLFIVLYITSVSKRK